MECKRIKAISSSLVKKFEANSDSLLRKKLVGFQDPASHLLLRSAPEKVPLEDRVQLCFKTQNLILNAGIF